MWVGDRQSALFKLRDYPTSGARTPLSTMAEGDGDDDAPVTPDHERLIDDLERKQQDFRVLMAVQKTNQRFWGFPWLFSL